MTSNIKQEIKLEDGMSIKPEPDDDMDISEAEDDDSGELQFPKTTPQNSWLMRVPKDLWAGLSSLNMDDQIQVGELWEWKDEKTGKTTIRWKLGSNVPGFDLIAKEYDIQPSRDITGAAAPKNTFVFSEKDVPGFQRGRGVKQEKEAIKKTEGGRVDKKQYRGPRTIPKHTAYVAAPEEEVQCHPRENDEWFAIQARKEEYTRANRPTLARTTIDPKEDKPDYDSFLRINDVTKKPRKTENKYQRIDEAALISMLQECFARHPFWPIRALKEAVKQPEAYLREVLSKVAHLVRSGHFANTWKLNAAFENVVGLTDQELEKYEQELASKHNTADIAPDVAGGSDDEDDDMEDVVLD